MTTNRTHYTRAELLSILPIAAAALATGGAMIIMFGTSNDPAETAALQVMDAASCDRGKANAAITCVMGTPEWHDAMVAMTKTGVDAIREGLATA